MPQAPFKIIVVGGGTSGWLSAALLQKTLGSRAEITLIESEDIGIIGVGESTVPTLRSTLKFLEIEEWDFLKNCNGTFKVGLQLVNWKQPVAGQTHRYFHSFGPMPQNEDLPLSELWLKLRLEGCAEPFDYSCYMNPWICDRRSAPKFLDQPQYEGVVDYTYQVDAFLMARYLRKLAIPWGVKRVVGKIVTVDRNEAEGISRLTLHDGSQYRSDLYVDCSGFQAMLLEKTLGEPFHSYAKFLLCDRAVALQVPRGEGTIGIQPYTTAHARDSGWIWNIPLQNRDGTGYVFSSACLDPESAEADLKTFLGHSSLNLPANHIRMRIGRHQRSWVQNCLAVGLASGFIEPLESSGIGFIYHAINFALPFLTEYRSLPERVTQFNDYIGSLFDTVRDFIVLHYCLTDREDTEFWRANRHELQVPDALQANLEAWREFFPSEHLQQGLVTLYDYKIIHILAGLGYLPKQVRKAALGVNSGKILNIFNRLRYRYRSFAQELPDHAAYLLEKCGGDIETHA